MLAKKHLRVDHDDEDELIAGYVAAATERLDGWSGILGRCLGVQTWKAYFAGFGGDGSGRLRLPLCPVTEVTEIAYYDQAGASQTLGQAAWQLLADFLSPYVSPAPGASLPGTYPREDAISVTFQAGYAEIPAPLVSAILLIVGDLYANRETVTFGAGAAEIPMSTSVKALLAPYRAVGF
ncbi:MAG: phage head-tail connector protein [Rhizobiales bacterium]|nr:phage head-tail connector protein [Hyphomicrobiales bacterium]MBN9010816.1 phage head-tail connector protein [Hyphomicrobiales bacterium]